MHIGEVMTRPAITCRASESLDAAAGRMWEHDCGALPVVDDKGLLIGMVTDRDICMAAYTAGRDLHALRVGDAMAKRVFSCAVGDELTDAEATMARAQVRRLPVVDGAGRPIGIVSINDLARATASGNKRVTAETVATLAAICTPRKGAATAHA